MASAPDTSPEPLSLDEVKVNLRVDGTDEDALIEGLIIAAREHVEDFTGLVLTPRAVTETFPDLPGTLRISAWPVAAKADIAVSYVDRDGIEQEIDPAQWYIVPGSRPVIVHSLRPGWGIASGLRFPGCNPRRQTRLPYPVVITVQAGFATPDDVPMAIKRAMHLLIGNWYKNRESDVVERSVTAVELPTGVKALLRRWRRRTA